MKNARDALVLVALSLTSPSIAPSRRGVLALAALALAAGCAAVGPTLDRGGVRQHKQPEAGARHNSFHPTRHACLQGARSQTNGTAKTAADEVNLHSRFLHAVLEHLAEFVRDVAGVRGLEREGHP